MFGYTLWGFYGDRKISMPCRSLFFAREIAVKHVFKGEWDCACVTRNDTGEVVEEIRNEVAEA